MAPRASRPSFFPAHAVDWHLHEPAAFRRMSLRLLPMAALAGVLIRLYRLALLTYGSPNTIWVFFFGYAFGTLIVLALATAHLGNYPVRTWLWRAPLFGLTFAAFEMAASAALVALRLERIGTDAMHWHDWRSELLSTLVWHTLAVCLFAVVLALVVQTLRVALLRRDHRESTAQAIHQARTEEHQTIGRDG